MILALLAFRHFGQGYAVLLLAIWIGVGFVFSGVAMTGSALSEPSYPGRGWAIFGGVISTIAGMVVLAWPFDSIVVLAWVTGIWLVAIGLVEIVSAFQIRGAANTIGHAGHGGHASQDHHVDYLHDGHVHREHRTPRRGALRRVHHLPMRQLFRLVCSVYLRRLHLPDL